MKRVNKFAVTKIKRSCITGRVVWIYQGPSNVAARVAYHRACKHEFERVARWPEVAAARSDMIQHLLSECMAEIPINAQLTPAQKKAARTLKAIKKEGLPCDMEFYEHIIEERRRRAEDREIRRQMREREAKERKQKEQLQTLQGNVMSSKKSG